MGVVTFLLYSLLFIYLGCLVATVIGLMFAWYDMINRGPAPCQGAWRKQIKPMNIALGALLEAMALSFQIITIPLQYYYDKIPSNGYGKEKFESGDKVPILMVHGWGSGSHSFIFIYHYLHRLGFKHIYAITYRPVMKNVGSLAKQVSKKVDEILEETGAPYVDIITHSMGGVLTRYAIKNLGIDDKVRRAIMLGGPHMGTRASVFMPIGKNTLQMIYNSNFCQELAEGGMTPGQVEYTSIYSNFDNIVYPPNSSHLGSEANNVIAPFHGHVYLLYSPRVIKLIANELTREEASMEQEDDIKEIESKLSA